MSLFLGKASATLKPGDGSINSSPGDGIPCAKRVVEVRDLLGFTGEDDLDSVKYQSTGPDGEVILLTREEAVRVVTLGWARTLNKTESIPVVGRSVIYRLPGDAGKVIIKSEKKIDAASVEHGFSTSDDYHEAAKIVKKFDLSQLKEQVGELVRLGRRKPVDELTLFIGEEMLFFEIRDGKIWYSDSTWGYFDHPPGESRHYEDLGITINHVL